MILKWNLSKWESIYVDVPNKQVETLTALGKEFDRQEENAGRKARRHKEVSIEEKYENTNEQGEQFRWEPIDETANAQYNLERLETRKLVRQAILSLSADKQDLIRAIFYDEISIAEFAKRKGVSFQAKYKQYAKVKTELKNLLQQLVE